MRHWPRRTLPCIRWNYIVLGFAPTLAWTTLSFCDSVKLFHSLMKSHWLLYTGSADWCLPVPRIPCILCIEHRSLKIKSKLNIVILDSNKHVFKIVQVNFVTVHVLLQHWQIITKKPCLTACTHILEGWRLKVSGQYILKIQIFKKYIYLLFASPDVYANWCLILFQFENKCKRSFIQF